MRGAGPAGEAEGGDVVAEPEVCLDKAVDAANREEWDRATAYAAIGLLAALVGAAKTYADIQRRN